MEFTGVLQHQRPAKRIHWLTGSGDDDAMRGMKSDESDPHDVDVSMLRPHHMFFKRFIGQAPSISHVSLAASHSHSRRADPLHFCACEMKATV